jgi:hypothetical protein
MYSLLIFSVNCVFLYKSTFNLHQHLRFSYNSYSLCTTVIQIQKKWKPTVIPTSMQMFDPIPQLNNPGDDEHGWESDRS